MRYTDEKISVVFDDTVGFTKAIYNPKDKFKMNWILDNSNWGEVIGFNEYRVEKAENGINVYSENNSLGLSKTDVTRKIIALQTGNSPTSFSQRIISAFTFHIIVLLRISSIYMIMHVLRIYGAAVIFLGCTPQNQAEQSRILYAI